MRFKEIVKYVAYEFHPGEKGVGNRKAPFTQHTCNMCALLRHAVPKTTP